MSPWYSRMSVWITTKPFCISCLLGGRNSYFRFETSLVLGYSYSLYSLSVCSFPSSLTLFWQVPSCTKVLLPHTSREQFFSCSPGFFQMIEVCGNKSLFSSLCDKIPGIPEGAAFSLQSMEGHQVAPSFYNLIQRYKIHFFVTFSCNFSSRFNLFI